MQFAEVSNSISRSIFCKHHSAIYDLSPHPLSFTQPAKHNRQVEVPGTEGASEMANERERAG